jgi:hypothetical protein
MGLVKFSESTPTTIGLLLFWIILLLFSQHFKLVAAGNETAIQTNTGKFFSFLHVFCFFFGMN